MNTLPSASGCAAAEPTYAGAPPVPQSLVRVHVAKLLAQGAGVAATVVDVRSRSAAARGRRKVMNISAFHLRAHARI